MKRILLTTTSLVLAAGVAQVYCCSLSVSARFMCVSLMFRYTRIVCSERLIGRPKMLFV